jgi:carboxylate-amine ligase
MSGTGETVGVEEEFLLVDARTGRPAPRIHEVIGDAEALAGDAAQPELHRAQIETATPPCRTLAEVGEELRHLRADMARAAAAHGAVVVASGTYPDARGRAGELITDKSRYEAMAAHNAFTADEMLICGCHVHVSVADDEEAIAVINRIRRHLPVLAALAANSPFWEGRDTGFASFRSQVWARWPTSGPSGRFADAAEYRRVLGTLVDAGVILDRNMAYWDARPSQRFPTVEVRVADVCLDVEDAVMVAGLARALVAHAAAAGDAVEEMRPEWQRAAAWMAARYGLAGGLFDPAEGRARPARQAVTALLEMVEPQLDGFGDGDTVRAGVERVLAGGTGADRQRAAFTAGGFPAVIDLANVSGGAPGVRT